MANNFHKHRPISMPFDRIVLATLLDNLPQKLFTHQSTSCNCYHGNQRTHADQRLCYYSAPAHRARATVEYLCQATPDFISPDVWPPNSPDLNPVDYRIWGCLQDHVYQKRTRDINELKQHLVDVWSDFGQTVIDRAMDERRKLSEFAKSLIDPQYPWRPS